MTRFSWYKKVLIVGIIIFLMLSLPSINADSVLIKEISLAKNEAKPVPILDGILGDNGWYISSVTITFIYDPDVVKEIWFSINCTGEYQKYEGPFNISIEGKIMICWYWIKFDDIKHFESPFIIPIDLSPPTVKISKIPGYAQITFTANSHDNISEIARVEFYLDDEFQAVDNESPYKWTYKGTESYLVYAKAYDGAGHYKDSEKISTSRFITTNFFKILTELIQKIIVKFF